MARTRFAGVSLVTEAREVRTNTSFSTLRRLSLRMIEMDRPAQRRERATGGPVGCGDIFCVVVNLYYRD